jgi:hypothetical protein
VGKLDPSGTQLIYCGFIGGSDVEQGNGLALDSAGYVYVIGYTESGDFPVVNGPDLTFNGSGRNVGDAFIVKVNPVPNATNVTSNFAYGSFIGGSRNDWAFWVAVDPAGNAYVIGDTQSSEATFPNGQGFGSIPGFRTTFIGGNTDAFILKIQP